MLQKEVQEDPSMEALGMVHLLESSLTPVASPEAAQALQLGCSTAEALEAAGRLVGQQPESPEPELTEEEKAAERERLDHDIAHCIIQVGAVLARTDVCCHSIVALQPCR